MHYVTRLLLCAATVGGAVAAGCKGKEEGAACPSNSFVGAVHDAAFHFEHGAWSLAVNEVARAHAAKPAVLDERSRQILALLTPLSREVLSDAGPSLNDAQQVRFLLSDWRCLPPELHRWLHARLP